MGEEEVTEGAAKGGKFGEVLFFGVEGGGEGLLGLVGGMIKFANVESSGDGKN